LIRLSGVARGGGETEKRIKKKGRIKIRRKKKEKRKEKEGRRDINLVLRKFGGQQRSYPKLSFIITYLTF
jgi:hypothetical protein